MHNPFRIFKIRKDERWFFFIALIVLIALNAVFIYSHCPQFLQANHGHIGSYTLFVKKLNLTGYDPYTYMTLTQFDARYTINRHPLVTWLLYPFYLLNHWVMTSFDVNIAMFIMGLFTVLASAYSALFVFRTLREVVGIDKKMSLLLTAMLFSFAAIMTSAVSPDLFIYSMFMLTLTMYVFGSHLRSHLPLAIWKSAVLYFLTAGVTLTNGLKTLLSVLFLDGKHTFRWKNVVFILIIPTALLALSGWLQYDKIYLPRTVHDDEIIAKKKATDYAAFERKDSIAKATAMRVNGKTDDSSSYLNLLNPDASRIDCTIELFFGESVQMHKDYLLVDVCEDRPNVVPYHGWWKYAVEGIIVALLVMGIVAGRRDRFMQMMLAWWAVDIFIHIVCGFGLNEANIYGCHWMFIIPVAMAFLYKRARRAKPYLLCTIALLTGYLWIYNGYLLCYHLLG